MAHIRRQEALEGRFVEIAEVGIVAKQIMVTKKDVAWSYASTAFNSGIGFILLPILMFFLDSDILALWYIFLSLGAIVNLFDFGLTPSFSRNMTNAWSGAREILAFGTSKSVSDEPNYDLMAKVMGASRILYFGLAAFSALILLSVGTVYILYISSGIDATRVVPGWVVFCIAVFLNVYYGYYVTYLRGVGQVGAYSKITIAAKLIQVVISVSLLLTGWGLLAPVAAYAASGFAIRVLSKRCFERFVEVDEHPILTQRVSFSEIKQMLIIVWPNSWRDGLVSLSDYLTTQASTIVCSLFLSLSDSGIYAISMQLLTMVHTVSNVYGTAKRPAIQNAYVAQDRRRLASGVGRTMCVYGAFFVVGVAGIAFVVAPVLSWLSPQYVFDTPFLFVLGTYLYVIGRYKIYAGFIAMTNDLCYWKSFIASSILALGVAVLALRCFGSSVYLLVVPQFLVQLAYNAWKWPRYFRNLAGLSEKQIIVAGLRFS